MSHAPESIQRILEDLYQADPGLRSQEARLIPLIEHLLTLRPDAEPLTDFETRLRHEVLAKHAELYLESSPPFFSRMTSFFSLKQVAIPLGAMALGALLVSNILLPSSAPQTTISPLFQSGRERFTQLRGGAFGSLEMMTPGGGGALGSAAAISARSDLAQKNVARDAMIMPPEGITNYKYIYRGELPKWEANVAVYKRSKDATQNATLIQSLKQTTQGLANLDALQNLELQSFTLTQKQRYGYVVTVDLAESTIGFQQNYREWPNPAAACKDEACYQRLRLSANDIPADTELIGIAQAFLQAQGISTEGYGAPVVNNEWRRSYDLAADKSMMYVPDVVTVVYPIVIDGKMTYDEGGFPHGLMVNVSAREKRVESLWNLTTNRFERSEYAAETDEARIRNVMEKGGVYGYLSPEAEKTVEVELDAPEIIFQKVWVPREPGQPMDELLVPSLRFSLKNKPENMYTPSYILVPLVKDVLNQQPGDVRIMR